MGFDKMLLEKRLCIFNVEVVMGKKSVKEFWKKYRILTLIFIFFVLVILSNVNFHNSKELSIAIQVIFILYLIRISVGSLIYIKKCYQKQKYSYSIIMNLGVVLFFNINIIRMIFLLIENSMTLNIVDIYNNTLESFSFFIVLTLPCIIVLAVYSIITNIILIRKEGFTYRNLLGIILGLFALFGLFGSQVIFSITSQINLSSEKLLIKKFIDISIHATSSYFYSIIIATLYCNIMASRHVPKFDKDYIIILGSKIKNDGTLTPLLKGRADKAIDFGKKQMANTKKDIIYIPSGGKGSDEVISEAEAIKNYLLQNGVSNKNILMENESTSTWENMKFSKEKIEKKKKNAKVAFSTTNYHVFRSGVIACQVGIDCEGIGSSTKWYFYTNALIREFIANLVSQKKNHLIFLTIINVLLFVLVYIGYQMKFFAS